MIVLILTANTNIRTELIPALQILIVAGIGYQCIKKGIQAQEENKSIYDFFIMIKKPLYAGIISIVLVNLINIISKYFL